MDLKRERLGQLCQVFMLCQQKSLKKLLWLVLLDEIFFPFFLIALKEHFVYGSRHQVMTKAQN